MLNDKHLSPQGGTPPIDGSLPGMESAGLNDQIALRHAATRLSAAASEIFEGASRTAGFDGFFNKVYEFKTQLEKAGFDVAVNTFHLKEDRLSPVVSLVATDPVSGSYLVPGFVSASRYIEDGGRGAPDEPGKKYLANATEYDNPDTGERTSFKFERFPSEAAIVCVPGYESADEPCMLSVLQSPENKELISSSVMKSIATHGERYSYLLEEVVLPVVQRQLVEDSGGIVGQFERPNIDYAKTAFDPASPSLDLALQVPTSGAPERFVYRVGFTRELEPVVEDMRREALDASEL